MLGLEIMDTPTRQELEKLGTMLEESFAMLTATLTVAVREIETASEILARCRGVLGQTPSGRDGATVRSV